MESRARHLQPRGAGGVALAGRRARRPARVQADHDRLAQILINLVDNAVKYTPPEAAGSGERAAARAGLVEIEVADTGIGIPRVDLPRITERFYRVDKARSRELGGTGLGLAIVKHLVIAHGGELTIESEQGGGRPCRVTLPAAAGQPGPLAPEGACAGIGGAAGPSPAEEVPPRRTAAPAAARSRPRSRRRGSTAARARPSTRARDRGTSRAAACDTRSRGRLRAGRGASR